MEVVKSAGNVTLYSRRAKKFNSQFGSIAQALINLPDETVIDGEIVAVDEEGRPNFNLLQNFRSAEANVIYFAFDIMMLEGKDLTQHPLSKRRKILSSLVQRNRHIEISESSNRPLPDMMTFVRSHGLEGVVAKRADGCYQSGLRTGIWCKRRLSYGQEFVIGGYIPSPLGVDSLVVGVYRRKELHYTARVRAGFVPATRRSVFNAIKHLKTSVCPFVNLPEKNAGRRGQGLTAEKMVQCVWLKPRRWPRLNSWNGLERGSPAAHKIHPSSRRQRSA
jgi:bifunctional non-homologous end joining protein LigD